MQKEDRSTPHNQEHALSTSLCTQNILRHLEKQLARPHEPSHDAFKKIIESVLDTPEAYRATGLTAIAQHFVNGMALHLLALLTTFQEKAEQEGISLQERQTTLEDILPQAFQTLETLSNHIRVQSLDELAALNNITTALYTLSSTDTAEEAQQWLYELPPTYVRRLRQAGLLTDEQSRDEESKSQTKAETTHFVNWPSVQPLQEPVPVPIEAKAPGLAA